MSVRILVGDALTRLKDLPDGSVHTCITSPPYWGLRSYQGDPGMIGLEPTFDDHLENIVAVFREVRRVLRDDGICVVNYGDAYAATTKGSGGTASFQTSNPGSFYDGGRKFDIGSFKPKDLMMMPARVAMALQADGWWLRSQVPWIKPNPMPESATDRPTTAVEYFYMFSKKPRYFYDHVAVRTPGKTTTAERDKYGYDNSRTRWGSSPGYHEANPSDTRKPDKTTKTPSGWDTGPGAHGTIHREGREKGKTDNHRGRTPKDTDGRSARLGRPPGWRDGEPQVSGAAMRNYIIAATKPFKGAHFATFPPDVVRPWIAAGTSDHGCCSDCGAPWVRETDKELVGGLARHNIPDGKGNAHGEGNDQGSNRHRDGHKAGGTNVFRTTGWQPACDCDADVRPCTVMDPFGGSGTVGLVADQMRRDAVLIEISPEYAEMARARIADGATLLADVSVEQLPDDDV